MVIALLVPLTQYETFLYLIGAAFVPLLGVLLADYFVLHRRQYDAVALATVAMGQPGYGARWAGIVTWLAGVVVYLAISGLPAFGVPGLLPALGATLPSFVVSFGLYLAVGRLGARQPAPASVAA